jgi:dienelactone hydrolase
MSELLDPRGRESDGCLRSGMKSPLFAACVIAMGVLLSAGSPPPLSIGPATIGGPGSNAPVELYRPAGPGPFPAMVILHGCDGIGRHYREWARRLSDWGYLTLLVDSFRPRGMRSVCNRGRDVPPEAQATDGKAAAAFLATQPDVRGRRIGVIGFSHGGWAVLKAVLADSDGPRFAAAIAFYPGCEAPTAPLVTDTLILIGDADDWTPAERCARWGRSVDPAGHSLVLRIYHGALHGFDAPLPPHAYAGHWVGRDDAAADGAIAETRIFLAARLQADR